MRLMQWPHYKVYQGSDHWLNGGTGITNFLKQDRKLYEDAIKVSGCTCVMIVDKPIRDASDNLHASTIAQCNSLHFVGKLQDLSDFWQTFRNIEKLRKVPTA